MRRYQNIDVKLACPFRRWDEPGADQDAGLMRITDQLLFYSITALRIRAGDVIAQSMRLQTHGFALKIAFLFVKEGFAISNQELGITNLRTVDGRVIDFCEDAHRHGKPDPAGGRICSSNAIFRAGSPCGIDA